MEPIYNDLYQFTEVKEPMKLSMHQYLLVTEEPVLIHTGPVSGAENNIPKIKELLQNKPLKYILVSHFESDECGGLSVMLREYPEAIVICSEVTARQLIGFGITENFKIMKPGETLNGNDFELKVISYPSEMHLWEGLLFMECKRGIFFSSDLMFAIGETHGQVIESTWKDAVNMNNKNPLPNKDLHKKLIDALIRLHPSFVASGHGECMKILK